MDTTFLQELGLCKSDRYKNTILKIRSLIKCEPDLTANLCNITSALKYSFPEFSWVGFYLRDGQAQDELILNAFQGKPACTRIRIGKGVCGTAALLGETIIVSDVSEFPGHIYCDPDSKSEIVVPLMFNGNLLGVLDIDSTSLSAFDNSDKLYLEIMISEIIYMFNP